MSDRKPGILICEGCRIGQTIDTAALCAAVNEKLQPAFCRSDAALCSPGGSRLLRDLQGDEIAGGLVIAACGKGTRDDVLEVEGIHSGRVNLRELVAWAMEPGEDAQAAAEDYISMEFAGLQRSGQPEPFLLEAPSKEILVVGGGVTGMQAALDGAAAGYSIHLVEKEKSLGGWSAKWKKQIPFDEPFGELREPVAKELAERVAQEPGILVKTGTTIAQIEGEPGAFSIHLKGDHDGRITAGSVVTAAGWRPYRPAAGSFYGLGEVEGVMTSVEFEEESLEGREKSVRSVLFVQCAGSRDSDHLPYCSSVCCGISLKQARYIREQDPDAVVYIVYRDIRTPGFMEDFYKEVQDDPNILFIKGDVTSVASANGKIGVEVSDRLLGEKLSMEVEKVVLATGMVPNDTKELKLAYRLGEGLPELKYDFSDSHFICFPYETRRTGIFAAGGIRAPQDIPSSMADGSGAMMKAIQMVESVIRGEAVHPRSGDRSYPELYMERCTDCKRCTEECPFGTYDETPSGTPVVHPNRCRRCGICMGACPERVISFADYSITRTSEMIKAVSVPDEFEEKPRVLVFVCENDALPALEMAVRKGLKINPFVRVVPVRCLGSVNRVWVSDALSKGYDGILQIGCKPGDDYQCHFIHGSELTGQRSEIYEETLSSMMLEPERISTEYVEITDYRAIIEHIDNYMEEVDLMGPNPFKDM